MAKMRLGLIIDPEFHMLGRSVCALTPPFIEALCRRFDTRLLWDQRRYDALCWEVDFIYYFHPTFAAPMIRLARAGRLRRSLPPGPIFWGLSDPHLQPWREAAILDQGVDFVLAYYRRPTLHHFGRLPPEKVIFFPWAVPDPWIDTGPIRYHGQRELMIFGAAQGEAYTVRNWCRRQPGVRSYEMSGVENKVMDDRRFFEWLQGFDAVIAAGSESPAYRLTTPKYYETAAAGSLLVAQTTDDLAEAGFADGLNCLVFSQADFHEKVRPWREAPDDPRWLEIRRAGRELIRERHSLSRRLDELEGYVRAWPGR